MLFCRKSSTKLVSRLSRSFLERVREDDEQRFVESAVSTWGMHADGRGGPGRDTSVERTSYTHLRKDLGHLSAAPVWPPGCCLTPFDVSRHAEPGHRLLAKAYRDGSGRVAPFATWWPSVCNDPECDPSLFFLATDGRLLDEQLPQGPSGTVTLAPQGCRRGSRATCLQRLPRARGHVSRLESGAQQRLRGRATIPAPRNDRARALIDSAVRKRATP